MIQSAQGTVMMAFFQLSHPRDQDLSFVLLKENVPTIKKNIIRTNAHELLWFLWGRGVVKIMDYSAAPQFDCFLKVNFY